MTSNKAFLSTLGILFQISSSYCLYFHILNIDCFQCPFLKMIGTVQFAWIVNETAFSDHVIT